MPFSFDYLAAHGVLPLPGMRWTPQRKAKAVVAVDKGYIDVHTVLERYNLSLSELSDWRDRYYRGGIPQLKVHHV